MSAFIESNDYLEEWLADEMPPDLLLAPLRDDIAKEVVNHLEKEFDRYWYIDVNRSLNYSERIIAVGRGRNDTSQIAFGAMRKADCLAALGSLEEAWELYEQAGLMFQTVGDDVGWGRTRIGRLYLGPKLNRVSITLSEAEQARAIFIRY